MKNRLIALALMSALGAPGCADNKMSLEVQAICAFPDDCVFGNTCDLQIGGVPSVAAGEDLHLAFQVANQLPNNADLATGRVNTNDAHVTGVVFEASGSVSGMVDAVIGNQFVPADSTNLVMVTLPFSTATVTTPAFVDGVMRLTGYFDNGREFETGDFPLPVAILAATEFLACPGTMVVSCPPSDGVATVPSQYPSACAEP